MCHDKILIRVPLCNDVANPNLRVILAMALGALVLLLALEFEHQNLIAAIVRGDSGVHTGFAELLAKGQLAAILEKSQYSAECDLGAWFTGQFRNAHHIARSDAELLPASFDNCMHGSR